MLEETVRAILQPDGDSAHAPDDAFNALLEVARGTLVDKVQQDAQEGWMALMELLQQLHQGRGQPTPMEKIFGGIIDDQVPLRPQTLDGKRKGVSLRVGLKHCPLHSTHVRTQVTSRALDGSQYAAIGRTGAVDVARPRSDSLRLLSPAACRSVATVAARWTATSSAALTSSWRSRMV